MERKRAGWGEKGRGEGGEGVQRDNKIVHSLGRRKKISHRR